MSKRKDCDGEPDGRLTVRRPLSMRPVGSVNLPQHADQHHPNDPILLAVDQQLGAVVFGSTPMTRPPSSTRASASTIHTSDPALLRAILKVRTGWAGGYWWVECGTCGAGWQVPHYAESIG